MGKLIVLDDDKMCFQIIRILNIKCHLFPLVERYNNIYSLIEYLSINKERAEILPDALFVDISSPNVNGWEFLELYKALQETLCKRIRIYIIAAFSSKTDIIRAKSYSFIEDYIIKPIAKDKMIAVFNASTGTR